MTHTGPVMEADQYTEILIAELIQTEDFKRVTRSFIHQLLHNWAGESGLKKRLAPSIAKRMQKSLLGPESNGAFPVSEKIRDPQELTTSLIALVNDMLARMAQLGSTLQEMDSAQKEALLETIAGNVHFGHATALWGPLTGALTDARQKNPTFLADILQERLTAWMQEVDFTTVTSWLNASREDMAALSRTINDALWQSPERVREVLEIIPALTNLLTGIVAEFLGRLNKLKTDEITDLFLHLLDQLDGESLGEMLNAHGNINHKIMKGTEELRDPAADIPSSENVLMRKMEEVAGKMDPNLIFKLRLSLEDLKVPLREWLMSD